MSHQNITSSYLIEFNGIHMRADERLSKLK